MSYKCPVCGNAIEEDGVDDTPEEIRNAIILQEGEYKLFVTEGTHNVAALITILRKVLNLDLKEAAKLKKLVPGTILKGTKAEMDRLQVLLKNDGIDVLVEKV